MKRLIIALSLVVITVPGARSQVITDGIWNAGGIYMPVFRQDHPSENVQIQKSVVMIDLYPGISVAKSVYELFNADSLSLKCRIMLINSGRTPEAATGMVHIRPSSITRILVNDSLVKPISTEPGQGAEWDIVIPANSPVHLVIYQLTQNHQAKLYREGDSRDGNAFVFIFSEPQKQQPPALTVMIRFREQLTLTNILGISPGKKTRGDLHHLQYTPASSTYAPLVIWYEGSPPDFKFQKNILPNADYLFREIDQFPLSDFNNTPFTVIDRFNFTANPKNPLAAIIYFVMFFVPWIILGAFIIFLIRKPRKKNTPE